MLQKYPKFEKIQKRKKLEIIHMNSEKSMNQFEIEKRIFKHFFLINICAVCNKIDFFQIFFISQSTDILME